ncbi:MAG: hypothetical protein IPG96_20520 [Proteobacteria bacterium]|nr:hypothetical protein [Pseudomonadota bacterium]
MTRIWTPAARLNPPAASTRPVSYEVFSGIALACADKAYRPLPAAPVSGPEVQALDGNGKIPTFTTYFRYLCIQSWDEAQGKAVYRCGKGRVADGVSGYAIRTAPTPRAPSTSRA